MAELLANESVPLAFVRVLRRPYLRTTALLCIASIFRNFFFLQYRSAFLPGRIPVTQVDHPLDIKIPFLPCKVNIYLDFVALWVRSLGFLLKTRGRRVLEPVRDFMESMGKLYAWAAMVYRKNLSTTKRPFYISHPRFFLIHAVDPHLMCIPSLHVMVVIRTYTRFREITKELGEEAQLAAQTAELYQCALDITESVLYVKQHSVNCIPAALYAMTKFNPDLFPPDEAERFLADLYRDEKNLPLKDSEGNTPGFIREEIKNHVLLLYRRFLTQSENEDDWTKPLMDFLKEMPKSA